MRIRDLAIVAAVLALAVFAVADALRTDGAPPASPTIEANDGTNDAATTDTNDGARPESFAGIPAPGSLAFTDAEDCRLREVDVGTGLEFPLPRIPTSCELWAPPNGERLAYGLGGSFGDAVPFRFVDLNHSRRDLGAFQALFGFVTWSADGQRAAWCDNAREGFDYELGRDILRLARCPRAYTPAGEVAYVRGRRVLVDDRTVLTASGRVDHVSWGQDGSLALLLDGWRLERRQGTRVTHRANLPTRLRGRLPIMSPDNCAALFPVGGAEVHVVELCLESEIGPFRGTAAAWSPDGNWVAVADDDEIVFYPFGRRAVERDVARWHASARELAWLG